VRNTLDDLRCFVLDGTGHRTRGERNAALAGYVRRRTARAEPKTAFAPGSPIRQWTAYPARPRDEPPAANRGPRRGAGRGGVPGTAGGPG